MRKPYPNLTVISDIFPRQVRGLLTIIRDRETDRRKFIFYADRLIRLLVEQALEFLPVSDHEVTTPLDVPYLGVKFEGHIFAVPIIRAGISMERAVRDVCDKIRIAHVLVQRDEATAKPQFIFDKIPASFADRYALLLDPMLATGGSASETIMALKKKGLPEERIIFVNLVACWEGVSRLFREFPSIRIVTAEVDEELDERAYIVPGLGDFGDRYMGTD